MKYKKCPARKTCWDYKENNCDGCELGEVSDKLHKRIDRLKKQNKTLTAEKEALIYKIECLLSHATGGKLSKHTYDLKTMETAVTDYINEAWNEGYADAAKQVPMEIFEEIDRIIFGHIIPNDCAIISIVKLAELKKKYTQGGSE